MIKFREDPSSRILRKDEDLCVLLGKLEDVQAMLGKTIFCNVSNADKFDSNILWGGKKYR